jgi:hypothetical protein
MAMTLTKALDEFESARHNAHEWVRAIMRRKVEYALAKRGGGVLVRSEDDYLYEMVGECLAFLGRNGELDDAARFIGAIESYEEAWSNRVIAQAADAPTDLEQMHDEHSDLPDYLAEP